MLSLTGPGPFRRVFDPDILIPRHQILIEDLVSLSMLHLLRLNRTLLLDPGRRLVRIQLLRFDSSIP